MQLLADIAVLGVAILHIAFMTLEMLLWDKPLGHKILGLKPELAAKTRMLAATVCMGSSVFFPELRGDCRRFWWNHNQQINNMGSGITRYDYTYAGFFGTIHPLNAPYKKQTHHELSRRIYQKGIIGRNLADICNDPCLAAAEFFPVWII